MIGKFTLHILVKWENNNKSTNLFALMPWICECKSTEKKNQNSKCYAPVVLMIAWFE